MYTINDLATEFGLHMHTFRYWLKKNSNDFERSFYDFRLMNLFKKIKIKKKVKNMPIVERNYIQYIVLDLEEFRHEFLRYLDFVESMRYKKKIGNVSWTNSAIDCYLANLDCNKCFNLHICEQFSSGDIEPPMKSTVRKLLIQIGKPRL